MFDDSDGRLLEPGYFDHFKPGDFNQFQPEYYRQSPAALSLGLPPYM